MNIKQIKFGILSPEEIENMAVCDITEVGNLSSYDTIGKGTVYDPAMGFSKNCKGLCETCHLNYKDCPGHIGKITLVRPIFNPMFFNEIVNYLKSFCHSCKKPRINTNLLKINKIFKINTEDNFKNFVEICKKQKIDVIIVSHYLRKLSPMF